MPSKSDVEAYLKKHNIEALLQVGAAPHQPSRTHCHVEEAKTRANHPPYPARTRSQSAVNAAVAAEAPDPLGSIAEKLIAAKSAIVASGSGVSAAVSADTAVAEAIKSAGVAKPTIAFVACTVAHEAAAIQAAFAKALPGCSIHGLTSSGAVLAPGGATPAGVGCLLIEAADGAFTTAFDAAGDATKASEDLKAAMPSPQAIILSTVPGSEEGALEKIAVVFPGVKVFGGTAADNDVSGKWNVWSSTAVSGTGVSLVGVGAAVKFGSTMLGPYTPTAKKAAATECEGRKVGKIGGMPAKDWVLEWIGDAVKKEHAEGGMILGPTSTKPVCITQPTGELVSSHLAILGGPDDGSATFFTPVPEGAELVVMDSADGPATGYASTLVRKKRRASSSTAAAWPSPSATSSVTASRARSRPRRRASPCSAPPASASRASAVASTSSGISRWASRSSPDSERKCGSARAVE